jgi:small subunit ribosomal protein S17
MADETPDTEAPEAEAEAPETEAAADAAPETEAAAAEPEVKLPPKEARRQARQRQTTSRRPGTPEERAELRKAKAAARRRRREQEKTRAREAREAGRAAGVERTPGEGTPPAPEHTGNPQVRTGTVVSDKADKTITVRIEVVRRHRRYGKVIRSTSTMHAHDERNDAHTGDLVRVVESRPLSRTKRWRLVEVLERAK